MAFQFVPNAEGEFEEGMRQTNPETGVEYIFTDGAWRPLGPKFEGQFDDLDERYVQKSGDIMHGQLQFDRGKNTPPNLLIYPNAGDSSSSFYALNNGALRFRSVASDNPDDQSTTHIAMGKTGESGGPETYIYHLQDPQDPNWAANKKYVDETAAEYLPLTGGTLSGTLDSKLIKCTRESGYAFEVKPNNTDTRGYWSTIGRIDINMETEGNAAIRTVGSINVKASGEDLSGSNNFIAHKDYVRVYSTPSDDNDVTNKAYVDDKVDAGFRAPGTENRPPGLYFKYQSGSGNPSTGMFRWYTDGGKRLNISTTSQDFAWGVNMPRVDINYAEGHMFTIWAKQDNNWKMKTTGTINRIDLHPDRMYCFVSYSTSLNDNFSSTAAYYITVSGMF